MLNARGWSESIAPPGTVFVVLYSSTIVVRRLCSRQFCYCNFYIEYNKNIENM